MIGTMNHLIVAYDNNRIIGSQGEMPWAGNMPEDMRRFRELTTGNSVIMGRKTFESIGRPLPNRQNIIITRQLGLVAENALIVHSLEEAYDAAHFDTFVIGGGEVYRQALDTIDIIHATEINMDAQGDVTFPELDPLVWATYDHREFAGDARNMYDYSFVTYKKVQ